jgi:hypothetical protein
MVSQRHSRQLGRDDNAATAWLTERADLAERTEDRIETVEWAVLIFVAVGVIVDVLLVLHVGSGGIGT